MISTATNQKVADIGVGGLPGGVALTPDGAQLWSMNLLAGNISVIDPATNEVVGAITGGPPQQSIDASPIAVAFVKA